MTASSPHQRAPEQSEIYFNAGGWRVRIEQAGINLAGALIIWLAFFSEGHVGSFGEQVFVWLMGALAPLAMAALTL